MTLEKTLEIPFLKTLWFDLTTARVANALDDFSDCLQKNVKLKIRKEERRDLKTRFDFSLILMPIGVIYNSSDSELMYRNSIDWR
jgi:hypothetical protein